MISVGDKIILQELDKNYLVDNPEIEEFIDKEVTIKRLYSTNEKDYNNTGGDEDYICVTCAYEDIDTLFLEEGQWELEKENINIPETFKEIDYKEICTELLSTLKKITEAESPRDMYDYALESLEKNKQKIK